MISSFSLALGSALFSTGLAVAVMLGRRRSLAAWWFSAGMAVLAAESVFNALGFRAVSSEHVQRWQTCALLAKSSLPGVWLAFSLSYSRGNYRQFLLRWRPLLVAAFLLPLALVAGFRGELLTAIPFDPPGTGWLVRYGLTAKILNALFLGSAVLILTNLERTFRSAVGTMQWRIKFLVLGVGLIFGARIYTRCQVLLFSGHPLGLVDIESAGILIGCTLMAIGYVRTGFGEIDVYPSRTVLHTSFTALLAGAYLFFIGVLAQVVARRGETANFQVHALLILLGIAFLAVLLLSDRVRQFTQRFISRHFKRPEHDFREIWTLFTRTVSTVQDQPGMCAAAARLISGLFHTLSVSIWLVDDQGERLVLATSTSQSRLDADEPAQAIAIFSDHGSFAKPFDLEKATGDWTLRLKEATGSQFRRGGNRICVSLLASERWLGAIVLADRVNGVPYTVEELDLLQCIGDQIAIGLLNIQLAGEILKGKELEAFRTMSAFFVHDLKNAASTLSLTLQNLPVHFDDPAFRQDALRGIAKTVERINQLIERLGALRNKLEIRPSELDLNMILEEALGSLAQQSQVKLEKNIQPLPTLVADREQLHSVLTNLLLNARDALGNGGQVTVETSHEDGWAALSVTDNGCGMSAEFVRDSLFRPFHSTKKNGLGIGMFQSKLIVEAHGGKLQVKSEPGAGSTFRLTLPLEPRRR